MQIPSTLWCTWDECRHTKFIRRTTLQTREWRTADRCILSEDQCRTRLFTLTSSFSSSGRLNCENNHIPEEERLAEGNKDATV